MIEFNDWLWLKIKNRPREIVIPVVWVVYFDWFDYLLWFDLIIYYDLIHYLLWLDKIIYFDWKLKEFTVFLIWIWLIWMFYFDFNWMLARGLNRTVFFILGYKLLIDHYENLWMKTIQEWGDHIWVSYRHIIIMKTVWQE